MTGRRRTPHTVLVVPFGTGIGDMVNMRPLLAAIADHHHESRVTLLCDRSLAWLLPPRIVAVDSVHGVRSWRRPGDRTLAARALGRLSVPAAARVLGPLQQPRLTGWMTGYLRLQEYSVVINLLDLLTRLPRVEDRWTRGHWQPDPRHVIDLLAEALAGDGIAVPMGGRAPRLEAVPTPFPEGCSVLINTNAGSTLKRAPVGLWCDIIKGLHGQGFRVHLIDRPGQTADPRLLAAAPGSIPLSVALPDLPGLIAGADLVISPDTGFLHLAAAVGTPYVGLFGATDPRFTGPYNGRAGAVVEAPYEHPSVCRDCWKAQLLPSARCPVFTPDTCLSTVTAEAVFEAATTALRGGAVLTSGRGSAHPGAPGAAS